MKIKLRNPFDEKPPKKFGRLKQLNKANSRARMNPDILSMRKSEQDWLYEKRRGITAFIF